MRTFLFALLIACFALKSEAGQYLDVQYLAECFEMVCIAESDNNPDSKVGDLRGKFQSYGIAQIQGPYLLDAIGWAKKNKMHPHAKLLLASGVTSPEQLRGRKGVSFAVFVCYMEMWCKEKGLSDPTPQQIARLHNGGGPEGLRKASSLEYWNRLVIKVTKHHPGKFDHLLGQRRPLVASSK